MAVSAVSEAAAGAKPASSAGPARHGILQVQAATEVATDDGLGVGGRQRLVGVVDHRGREGRQGHRVDPVSSEESMVNPS